MKKQLMPRWAPAIKPCACFFVLLLVFSPGCRLHTTNEKTQFVNSKIEGQESFLPLLGRGGDVKILWGKGVYRTLKEELFGSDDRVTEEFGVLCLLADKLELPRKPWVGDILVCKSPKKGGNESGKPRAYVVTNVLLEFFNVDHFLRWIKEDPLFLVGLLKRWPICSYLPPYVDPNRKKVFSLCYRLKGWKEVNEKEDPRELIKKIPIFSEKSKWDEAEEIFVGEKWIHENVLKTIEPPFTINPKRF